MNCVLLLATFFLIILARGDNECKGVLDPATGQCFLTEVSPEVSPEMQAFSLQRIKDLESIPPDTECDNYCATAFSFPAVHYNGLCYATISGLNPYGSGAKCEASFHTMPDGWQVANDSPDTQYVANTYPWDTHALVYNVGEVANGYNDKLDVTWSRSSNYFSWCYSCYVHYDPNLNQYRGGCAVAVLITKPCPPIRSSLGEGRGHFCDKEFGYCFVDITTDALSAQAICANFYGTSLATVTDHVQNDWIYKTCKPADDCDTVAPPEGDIDFRRLIQDDRRRHRPPIFTCGCIIGLNDFGHANEQYSTPAGWGWFDGTTEDTEDGDFAAENWATGRHRWSSDNQPNDANLDIDFDQRGQDCVSIIKDLRSDHKDNSHWNDINCESLFFKMPFFCNAPDENHYIWQYVHDSSSSSSGHSGHRHHHYRS